MELGYFSLVPFAKCSPEDSRKFQEPSFSLLEILQNPDEVFKAKNIARIWSLVGGVLIPGTLVRCVREVNHSDIDFGRGTRRAALSGLLPIVDYEEGAGVEAVGTLAPDDCEQSLQPVKDGLQELCA